MLIDARKRNKNYDLIIPALVYTLACKGFSHLNYDKRIFNKMRYFNCTGMMFVSLLRS